MCLPKVIPGSHFKDLDLVTKLLAPSGTSRFCVPVIEVVSDESASNETDEDEENFEWECSQDIYDEQVLYIVMLVLEVYLINHFL